MNPLQKKFIIEPFLSIQNVELQLLQIYLGLLFVLHALCYKWTDGAVDISMEKARDDKWNWLM
jgi:hypothetical protein